MNLQRFVGDEGERFGRREFCDCRVHVAHAAVVFAPRGLHDQQLGGAEFDFHVGEFERDSLEFSDGLVELLARRGVFAGELVGAVAASEADRRDLQAGVAEPRVCDFKSLVRFAQDLRGGDAAAVKFQNAVVVAAVRDAVVAGAHLEAGRAFVN